MKKLLLTLALGASLAAGALSPAAYAQTPAPATAPASTAQNHAKIQEAVEKLGLTGRQKLQCARILKSAKDSNQPKEQTFKQLEGVLTPDQLQKVKAAAAAAAPAQKP